VDGFNEEEFTLAVLIDFEKAYDSVWREGLLVKLFKSGIQGKMWKWIQNFLDERLAKLLIYNVEILPVPHLICHLFLQILLDDL
jgi:hypothetical protein